MLLWYIFSHLHPSNTNLPLLTPKSEIGRESYMSVTHLHHLLNDLFEVLVICIVARGAQDSVVVDFHEA